VDEVIPTPDGWKRMGDIQVGDYVFDKNGNPTKVVAVSEIMLNRPCYKICFDDGAEIIADEQHQWLTFDAKELVALTTRNDEWRAKRRAKRPSRAKGRKSAKFVAAITERNKKFPPRRKNHQKGIYGLQRKLLKLY